MAISVPNATDVANKWSTVVATRQGDYQKGVSGAASKYQAGVDAAGNNYVAGVTAAVADGLWQNGVANKGSFYAQRASQIGPTRWTQGVSASKDIYQAAEGRILQAIAAVNLPPKQPKGSPANLQRVQAVVDAERAARF